MYVRRLVKVYALNIMQRRYLAVIIIAIGNFCRKLIDFVAKSMRKSFACAKGRLL